MERIHSISISHRHAPAEIREKAALTPGEAEALLRKLIKEQIAQECALLCTCNRTELYLVGEPDAISPAEAAMAGARGLDPAELMPYYRVRSGERAVRHLYRVAGGIDSMLLGEDEILGQVKTAFRLAGEWGTMGKLLTAVSGGAVTCAKRIRTETALSRTPVSIGTLAANAVFRLPGENKRLVIIGITGQMGTVVMKNVLSHGGVSVCGTSRSHGAGGVSPQYPGVELVTFSDRYRAIADADAVVSATTSPHYTVTAAGLAGLDGRRRLFLDLAVPRDIDPRVGELPGAQLLDLDHFQALAARNNAVKADAAEAAAALIDEELDELRKRLGFQRLAPRIPALEAYVRENTLEKTLYTLRKRAGGREIETLARLLCSLIEEE